MIIFKTQVLIFKTPDKDKEETAGYLKLKEIKTKNTTQVGVEGSFLC